MIVCRYTPAGNIIGQFAFVFPWLIVKDIATDIAYTYSQNVGRPH